ncbi:MAG: hypothetical protein KDA89_09710 [Planctomycetaceae bacterium]|nr:hypothetical protein [Planctomycetaceae bacterium]
MRLFPELPLLRRELTELANRRRTYVVRVVGAVIILLGVIIAYETAMLQRQRFGLMPGSVGIMQYLGVGGDVFERVSPLLFHAIQLLMPALACACITAEKESNTIGTLLLTRLSPLTIIIEKTFSRLVPMLTLILLTFPVLAYVFTLGGVDTGFLVGTLWLLFCECLLIASIAVLCSAWFASTVSAFIASYVVIAFFAMLTLSLDMETILPSAIWYDLFSNPSGGPRGFMAGRAFGGGAFGSGWSLSIFLRTIPAMLVSAGCLLAARLVLVRRAFVSQSSVLLKIFRVVDQFFVDLNDHTTGGIVLIEDRNELPEFDPVAWRERNKKSLGKARYLFRILVFLEGPTLFICLMAATVSARNQFGGLYMLQGLVWTLAVLISVVKGATLFSSERSRETLAPLLASPMTAVELVDQKLAGMKRLLLVLAVPVLTVSLTLFLMHFEFRYLLHMGTAVIRPAVYLGLSTYNAFMLLNLMAWISTAIGLRIHSQTKAVLTAVGTVLAGVTLPLVAAAALQPGPIFQEAMYSLSPAGCVMATEQYLTEPMMRRQYNRRGEEVEFPRLLWAGIATGIWTLVLWGTSAFVRLAAPRLLGRLDSPYRDQRHSEPVLTSMNPVEVPS